MIRVLIVHEVRLMCELIDAVLKHEADMEVAGYAANVDEAVAMAKKGDVVLVHTTLPNDGAFEITRALKTDPSIKVIVVGLPESESAILRYIEAGAIGYVLTQDSVGELLKNIRAAYNGQALVSPGIAAALIARLADLADLSKETGQAPPSGPDLSPRERQVLELIAEGLGNQEIADRLAIELGTVKNHVHNILDKLNVSRREDAATYLDAIKSRGEG